MALVHFSSELLLLLRQRSPAGQRRRRRSCDHASCANKVSRSFGRRSEVLRPLSRRFTNPRMVSTTANSQGSGLFADSAQLLSASLRYLKARVALFSIEAKEAGLHYGLAGAFVAAA